MGIARGRKLCAVEQHDDRDGSIAGRHHQPADEAGAVAGEAGLARFECDLPPAALAELHRFGGAVEPDRQTIGPSRPAGGRSEEHTSELQSLMRISYDVLCLKKTKQVNNPLVK